MYWSFSTSSVNQLKRISCSTSTSIKRWKVHLLFTFSRQFRHMYHIIICGLDVTLLSPGLFLSPLCVPAIITVGGCPSEERCAPRDFICRHSPWGHVRVGGRHMSSISGSANRTSLRAKTGERTDAVVHPLTLALCRLTKRSRCIYAHMCRTMTRSVDDAAETEIGTRRAMKRKICLFFSSVQNFLQVSDTFCGIDEINL